MAHPVRAVPSTRRRMPPSHSHSPHSHSPMSPEPEPHSHSPHSHSPHSHSPHSHSPHSHNPHSHSPHSHVQPQPSPATNWQQFDNYCVSADDTDQLERPFPQGNADRGACQQLCKVR